MNPAAADKRERDRRYERSGRNPNVRWYKTPAWRTKAKRQLEAEPFCRMCIRFSGQRNRATIADHIEPHRYDSAKFWAGALQSLCAHHHNGLKQSIERSNKAGCDENGMPTDPSHPWAAP